MNEFVYLALGSNLGKTKENFELSIKKLEEYGIEFIESSPLYKTPALLLENSHIEWNIPYLNCIIKVRTNYSPDDLLKICKKIEAELGRDFSQKWSPRPIDLDILIYKDKRVNTENLTIPHKAIFDRYFLLDELSFLYPEYLKNNNINYYNFDHQPVFMGILNVTPDSFSDGGINNDKNNFIKNFESFERENVYIIDIGAESTNPKAIQIKQTEELERLNFVFEYLKNKKFSYFKPLLSIDTYNYNTAEKAVESGFNIINDVNALKDLRMLELIKGTDIKYVLTHSLTVPPKKDIIVNGNVVSELEKFLEEKINVFEKNNIKKEQIIFDIGIGFGKNQFQNVELINNIEKFQKYGLKLLVGHSRKSFLKMFGNGNNFDFETLAISLKLSNKVDILRVHTPVEHQNALLAYKCCN